MVQSLVKTGRLVAHSTRATGVGTDSAAGAELKAWTDAGAEVGGPLVRQGELVGLLVVDSKPADDFF